MSASASYRKSGVGGRLTIMLLGLLLTVAGVAALTRSLRVWDDVLGAGSTDRSSLPVLTQDVSSWVNRHGDVIWPVLRSLTNTSLLPLLPLVSFGTRLETLLVNATAWPSSESDAPKL